MEVGVFKIQGQSKPFLQLNTSLPLVFAGHIFVGEKLSLKAMNAVKDCYCKVNVGAFNLNFGRLDFLEGEGYMAVAFFTNVILLVLQVVLDGVELTEGKVLLVNSLQLFIHNISAVSYLRELIDNVAELCRVVCDVVLTEKVEVPQALSPCVEKICHSLCNYLPLCIALLAKRRHIYKA